MTRLKTKERETSKSQGKDKAQPELSRSTTRQSVSVSFHASIPPPNSAVPAKTLVSPSEDDDDLPGPPPDASPQRQPLPAPADVPHDESTDEALASKYFGQLQRDKALQKVQAMYELTHLSPKQKRKSPRVSPPVTNPLFQSIPSPTVHSGNSSVNNSSPASAKTSADSSSNSSPAETLASISPAMLFGLTNNSQDKSSLPIKVLQTKDQSGLNPLSEDDLRVAAMYAIGDNAAKRSNSNPKNFSWNSASQAQNRSAGDLMVQAAFSSINNNNKPPSIHPANKKATEAEPSVSRSVSLNMDSSVRSRSASGSRNESAKKMLSRTAGSREFQIDVLPTDNGPARSAGFIEIVSSKLKLAELRHRITCELDDIPKNFIFTKKGIPVGTRQEQTRTVRDVMSLAGVIYIRDLGDVWVVE